MKDERRRTLFPETIEDMREALDINLFIAVIVVVIVIATTSL